MPSRSALQRGTVKRPGRADAARVELAGAGYRPSPGSRCRSCQATYSSTIASGRRVGGHVVDAAFAHDIDDAAIAQRLAVFGAGPHAAIPRIAAARAATDAFEIGSGIASLIRQSL